MVQSGGGLTRERCAGAPWAARGSGARCVRLRVLRPSAAALLGREVVRGGLGDRPSAFIERLVPAGLLLTSPPSGRGASQGMGKKGFPLGDVPWSCCHKNSDCVDVASRILLCV